MGRPVRPPYVSAKARRARAEARAAVTVWAAVALALAGLIWAAYSIDSARGISVSQSLRSAGL